MIIVVTQFLYVWCR